MTLELDPADWERGLKGTRFGRPVHYAPSLPSTNDRALALLESGSPEGTLVLADEQTRGKGRRDRTWHSPARLGLYASLVLRPRVPAPILPLVSLTAATGTARCLQEWGGLAGVSIKWPNDLVLGGRKLGGVLAEARGEAAAGGVVVGLGLNVNQGEEDFPATLRDTSTSLRRATGRSWDRGRLLVELLAAWEQDYDRLVAAGPSELLARLLRLSAHPLGSALEVDLGGEIVSGRFAGFGRSGQLLLDRGGSEPHAVHFGEVIRVRNP